MIDNEKTGRQAENMTIPRSVLFNSLKDAIETKDETRIGELTDILHSSLEFHISHSSRITENSMRIDRQHQDITNMLDTMKEGFRQMEKRFESVDKRFESIDKRFESIDAKFRFLSWLIGIGFVSINSMVVLLKIFG